MIRACFANASGGCECAIIRNPTVSSPRSRASSKCCTEMSASVQCVAIRHDRGAVVLRRPGCRPSRRRPAASARRSSPAVAVSRRDLDQFLLGRVAEAVVERRAAEPVAVRHLDHRHTGRVECRHDGPDVVGGELVPLGVRAVTQ